MQRQGRKPSHMDRDLLLYALWTNGLRYGHEIAPLTVNLAAHIMCEGRSTAAGRIKRLECDYGLIVKVAEAAGRRKTPFKVSYSQEEMDAIIMSALNAYNKEVDTKVSNSWDGHNKRSVQSKGWTQDQNTVGTTRPPAVASIQNNVVSNGQAVASNSWNGQGKGKGKESSKQASQVSNGNDSTVASLGDAEFKQRKLEPFGEHGRHFAEAYAKFMGINIPEAVGEMEMAAFAHGHLNVVEAIREAATIKDVRFPRRLFETLLVQQSKHGRREMPKEVEQPNVRRLTMDERCFR